ncbi:MAG: Gfo/Idh/MocA family oxidoreductase [bacterium]
MQKTKIGVIGCGNISGAYFKAGQTFNNLEIAACADLDPARAKAKAEEFKIPKACSVRELLADRDIQIVVNLTIPKAHAAVALAALAAGKHVYGEKPLAVTRRDGQKILAAAKARKLRVGSAPDTFFGGGIQTCRKLIDDGWIGKPVAASAFMVCAGHESWHPQPEFYYDLGGGPMLDMGPYYLTALVNLLGPIKRVSGSARTTRSERMITSQPQYGKIIKVKALTHYSTVLDFAQGTICSMIMSFDCQTAQLPRIEIYGTEGTLSVPDPNTFGGPVRIGRKGKDWLEVPLTHGYTENSRSIGVADMANAIQSGRPHRASGELAFHVLDAMEAAADSSAKGRAITLTSTCKRPAALPLGLLPGTLDA